MELNEQELKDMIKTSLQKAFSKNMTSLSGNDSITDNFISLTKAKNMAEEEVEEETTEESSDVLNQILMKIVKDEGNENGETTEATGAGSAGGFEAPLFSEPKKNTMFQPGTESKLTTKPEGGFVNEEKIEGGKADGMDIEDIAKMHNMDVDEIYDEFKKGIQHEMEHTSEMMVAIEIALDHLYEDPQYYTKLESMETGGEATEATTSASAGVYDAPFGGPKKDPLKLSNPDTVEKELRSVRDKNFPKFGGKGGKYVKVKKKCSKFPYCNQGDINALEFFEREMVKEIVSNTAEKTNVEEYVVRNIIAKELGYIQEQEDGEIITIELPDDYKPKSSEEHQKEWLETVPDKKAQFLLKELKDKEFEFNANNGLSGKVKILDVGPKGKIGGFFGKASDYDFGNSNYAELWVELSDLKYKGQSVPVEFYEMISRYLPPEEEEESYRGDPVESAIMHNMEYVDRVMTSLGMYLSSIRINPYARFR
jgi:hypothetical protein